jgi:hypothetical protein
MATQPSRPHRGANPVLTIMALAWRTAELPTTAN